MDTKQREAFEAAMAANHGRIPPFLRWPGDGSYTDDRLEWAWRGWQAALASDAAQAPIMAWATDDDRVISDAQKRQALKDGGANASSVRPFSIALAPVAPTPTVAADAAATSEDAYVAQRMTETLAEVYATIIGDDAKPEDESLNAIERVKKAAQVLRLEVDLYRAHSEELATTKRLFLAAAADLGAINEALGLDPEDGGAEPIIAAINELQAHTAAFPDENSKEFDAGCAMALKASEAGIGPCGVFIAGYRALRGIPTDVGDPILKAAAGLTDERADDLALTLCVIANEFAHTQELRQRIRNAISRPLLATHGDKQS